MHPRGIVIAPVLRLRPNPFKVMSWSDIAAGVDQLCKEDKQLAACFIEIAQGAKVEATTMTLFSILLTFGNACSIGILLTAFSSLEG